MEHRLSRWDYDEPDPETAAPEEPTVNTLKANRDQSIVDKPVKRVHEIASQMYQQALDEQKPEPRRKDVMQACVDAGIAYYTARTQYQVWYRNRQRAAALSMQQNTRTDR